MYHIKLVSSRVDLSAPFFWESTDPEIVELLNYIDTKSATLSHLYSGYNKVSVNNGYTYIVDWFFNSEEDWNTYQAEMTKDRPDLFTKRQEYFVNNDHKLYVEILDEAGNVLRSVIAILNSTGIPTE